MLTIRRRGSAGKWYVRGSVTLGERSIDVAEFSTGTADEDAARHLMAERERCLREELMFGPRVVLTRATISDVFEAYLTGHAPAGQDRYRSLLQAAVNVYNERHELPPFKLKAIPFDNQQIRFLSHADRDRLIGRYSPHVQPIATMFAFQGPRTQEALQLVWGAGGVDMERGTIFFARTKTGTPRTVEIHPRVAAALRPIWEERGKPEAGHVFLNRRGVPYTDTRDLKVQGGNPLQTAHENACRRAGIADFTVHDWRHHWASHCVMAGVDLITIMRLGGWKSLRMVQRYAAVDTNHMKAAVLRLR